MIQQGQILINVVSGERVWFMETSATTNGEYTRLEVSLAPGTRRLTHVHPNQSETFEVLEGTLSLRAGRDRVRAVAGDVVIVKPGEIHGFWNEDTEQVRFRSTVAPALRFEEVIGTVFSLDTDGKLGKRGLPSPIRLAMIMNGHFADVRLPYVPTWTQRALAFAGAALGRALGYAPTYEAKRPLTEFTPSALADRSEQPVYRQLGVAAPAVRARGEEQGVPRTPHLAVAKRNAPEADDREGPAAATG